MTSEQFKQDARQAKRSFVITEAVNKKMSQDVTFSHFWTYYTNEEMRALFTNRLEFILDCNTRYFNYSGL